MIKKFVLIFILIASTIASAQTPSVKQVSYRGNLENDRIITIYGNNFGTKETAAPVEWENWESYEVDDGNDVETSTSGKWTLEWASELQTDYKPHITFNNSRYENNRSLIKENTRDSANATWDLVYNTTPWDLTDQKILLSFWVRYIRMDNPVEGYNPQVKIAEFLHGIVAGNTQHPSYMYAVGAGGNWFQWNMYCNSAAMDPQPDCYFQTGDATYLTIPRLLQYEWTRQMLLIDKGSLCTTNGQVIYTARGHGVTPRIYSSTYGDSIPATMSGTRKLSFREDGTDYQHLILNGYLANVPYDLAYHNELNFDDIYVDNTWQRVEIGNSPVYGLCTELELQIPTYWSNGKIVVTGNIATLAQYNKKLYLFVINENNVPSNGYRIYPSFVNRPTVSNLETNR